MNLNYEIVTREPCTVGGIGTRTGNEKPDMMEKIGKLWMDFMMPGGACEKMPHKSGETCYGVYHNYTWDDSCYDVLAAWGVEEGAALPEGYQALQLPGGKFAKFSFRGDATKDTGKFWAEVWATPLPRAYTADFETYTVENGDESDAQIDIYVALADVCQSCGMPMTKDEEYGKNADGSRNAEYCCYCFDQGAFTSDCTMEEMIEQCLNAAPELYSDREKSRAMMREYFPSLKRWSK